MFAPLAILESCAHNLAVPDPDLEIGGGGGQGFRPLDNSGPGLQKNIFQPFRPQFALKIRGGRPSPGSTTAWFPINGKSFILRFECKIKDLQNVVFSFCLRLGYGGLNTKEVENS